MSRPEASKKRKSFKALVFVVDDEVMMGQMVAEILGVKGYEVRCFEGPEEGLAALREACSGSAEGGTSGRLPSLLITDYSMHGSMNGMELIQEVRGMAPNVKTLLYTGSLFRGAKFDKGGQPDFFLNKPFLSAELLKIVDEATGTSKASTPSGPSSADD